MSFFSAPARRVRFWVTSFISCPRQFTFVNDTYSFMCMAFRSRRWVLVADSFFFFHFRLVACLFPLPVFFSLKFFRHFCLLRLFPPGRGLHVWKFSSSLFCLRASSFSPKGWFLNPPWPSHTQVILDPCFGRVIGPRSPVLNCY